jgi:hypothetical protein
MADKMDIHMDDAATVESPPASAQAGAGLEAKYSCVICHKRKVRCDRAKPCSNCVRNAVDCEYKAPPAPRRSKKKGAGPFSPGAGGGGAAGGDAQLAGATPRGGARKAEDQRRRSRVFEEEGRVERASTESSGLRTFADLRGDRSASGESARGEGRMEMAQPKVEEGTLLVDGGKSRYLEK